jgi:hypothetical protein
MSSYPSTIQNPDVVDVRGIRTANVGTDITAVATAITAARNASNQGAVGRVINLLQQVVYAAREV